VATLEGIEATLIALQDNNAESHERLEYLVRQINGTVRANGNRITRIEEQQTIRSGFQATLSVAVGALAAWLGMRQ